MNSRRQIDPDNPTANPSAPMTPIFSVKVVAEQRESILVKSYSSLSTCDISVVQFIGRTTRKQNMEL